MPGSSSSQRQCIAGALALLAVAAGIGGCKGGTGDTFLVVTVAFPAQQPTPTAAIAKIVLAIDAGKDRRSHEYADDGDHDGVISIPSSFSIEMPTSVPSPVRIEVNALDALGRTIATAKEERVEFTPGERHQLDLRLLCLLECAGQPQPMSDAARPDAPIDTQIPDAGSPQKDASVATCGNGRLDDEELCDPGIAAGRPGACPPPDCDDKVPCTEDTPIGWGCRLTCSHTVIDRMVAGDHCCPAGADNSRDPDCAVTCGDMKRQADETCDIKIPAGAPGACPTEAMCDDADPCTKDTLISEGTCMAVCVHHSIAGSSKADGCCPVGVEAQMDPDCPSVCGNWYQDPGETCDRAIPSGRSSSCPASCERTSVDACKLAILTGVGCSVRCTETRLALTTPNDHCCPFAANRNLDSDCPAICGNGVLEPGETCDTMIGAGKEGACPSTCSKPADQCLTARLMGSLDDCSARCAVEPVTRCDSVSDGCCPAGCTATTDADCTRSCGNGVVDSGETCDTAIAPGLPGGCPLACHDTVACTTDRLLSAGTCQARCAFVPVMNFSVDDGCCPPGGNNLLDSDCPAVCGNGIVETPGETCDKGLPPGMPGGCAAVCPALPPGCSRFTLRGTADNCTTSCVLETIGTCANNDGCCPAGCTRENDNDCPAVCGNAVVEAGETCDIGLSAGRPGACPVFCDDGNACTTDISLGRRIDCTRTCRFDPITTCRDGDRCCPTGCTRETDSDCQPTCNNKVVEAGEFCDPPGTCPTRCPDDGDPCTSEVLTGDANSCQAHCESIPIAACSGADSDLCCPTGCAAKTDVDCPLPPAEPPLL
jgi:hypothetical protein